MAVPTSAPIASAPIVSAAAVAYREVGRSVVTVSVHDESGNGAVPEWASVVPRDRDDRHEILTSNRLVGSSDHVNVTTSDGVVHRA